MASTLSTFRRGAAEQAPFLIEPRFKTEKYKQVKLHRQLAQNDKRSMEVPMLTEDDVEMACHVCRTFDRASEASGLNFDSSTFVQ